MNLIRTVNSIINLDLLTVAEYQTADERKAEGCKAESYLDMTFSGDDGVALHGPEADAMWGHLNEAAIILTVDEA